MEDAFLVKQTLSGNRNAFRFLVLRYQKPVFKVLGTLIYDRQLVEEVAQETFLRAFRSLASFDPEKGAAFSTWLFTIARNLALNELEKRKLRVAHAQSMSEPEPGSAPGADEALSSAQANARVRDAIGNLPPEFRLAVVLSCMEGQKISDIARIEGCSEGTIKSRIFRGKQILRKTLGPILGDAYGK